MLAKLRGAQGDPNQVALLIWDLATCRDPFPECRGVLSNRQAGLRTEQHRSALVRERQLLSSRP